MVIPMSLIFHIGWKTLSQLDDSSAKRSQADSLRLRRFVGGWYLPATDVHGLAGGGKRR
jgi:hypothetical protein